VNNACVSATVRPIGHVQAIPGRVPGKPQGVGHHAGAGLEPDRADMGGRTPARPAAVPSQRRRRHVRRQRRRTPARRPARRPRQVARVERPPIEPVVRDLLGPELRHVADADDHRAGAAHPLDRQGVPDGPEIPEQRRALGNPSPGDPDRVLHHHWNAGQRQRLARRDPAAQPCRLGPRRRLVVVHQGVHRRVGALDLAEERIDDLDGIGPPGLDRCGDRRRIPA